MEETSTVHIENIEKFKQQALAWANQFNTVCYLDSNNYKLDKHTQFDCLIGIDSIDYVVFPSEHNLETLPATDSARVSHNENNPFELLHNFWKRNCKEEEQSKLILNQPLFGYLSYDLKNNVEKLESNNLDNLALPELFFFKPRYVIHIKNNQVTINRRGLEANYLIEQIQQTNVPKNQQQAVQLKSRINKQQYINKVEAIKQHIVEGNIYEMNLCNEFYAEKTSINALPIFIDLNEQTKAPFASFLKFKNNYVLSFSPERFLQKTGNKLISQPIKGTIKKGKTNQENKQLQAQLKADIKERAENVMIVDLVRNDLTKSSKTGTIKVDELFGIYEFETVNHMISTVSAKAKNNISLVDIIKNAFPMGSMTGAPKIRAMQIIEDIEETKRGVYSGAIGYITPNGNFDFNVVIRSLVYNANKHYLSLQTGGAITYDSVPEKEYDEMLLKAKAIRQFLA